MEKREPCPHCGSDKHATLIAKTQNYSFSPPHYLLAKIGSTERHIDVRLCIECGILFVPKEDLETLNQDVEKENEV